LIYRPPENNGLTILHADEDILVLSKPAGLLSVPGNKPDLQDCLETRAQHEFPTARTVHRLDRPTSGICVMALNHEAHKRIGMQFEKRETSKTYKAVVFGTVRDDEGMIEMPMRTDWYNRPKQMVDPCLGRDAVTRWQVEERRDDATRVALSPITGRSHQLRVHMQWLGHPIIGDEFYAAPTLSAPQSPRLLLHAESIEFTHPASNQAVKFTDPCPF
jgi:tRNA pseudouridine32 synthase/23S rRNA pseudouridine746 synthase